MNIWWWYSYEWMFHFLDNKINTSPDVIPHLIKLDSLLFTPNNTLKFLKFLQSSYFQAPTNTHTHTSFVTFSSKIRRKKVIFWVLGFLFSFWNTLIFGSDFKIVDYRSETPCISWLFDLWVYHTKRNWISLYEITGIVSEMAQLSERERSPNVQRRGFRVQAPLVSPMSSLTFSCLLFLYFVTI